MKLFYKDEGWTKHKKRKHDRAKSEAPKGAKSRRETSGGKVRAPNSTLERKLRVVSNFRRQVPAEMSRSEFLQA